MLPVGAILNLTGNGVLPLLQLAVTKELSAFILAMDKDQGLRRHTTYSGRGAKAP